MRRVTVGLATLRLVGCAGLVLLVWNPVTTKRVASSAPPLVLLDASLSMGATGGRWREALDSARTLARGGVIWRFGTRIAAFDSTPPTDGATQLSSALGAAAARGGPVAVVTDGVISDAGEIPADLLAAARVVALPRAPFRDDFVAAVEGSHRIGAADTFRLNVSYGVAGVSSGSARHATSLSVLLDGRRLAATPVSLPDSGIVSSEIDVPAARLERAGWSALEIRLDGARDSEPRDDARLFVVEVSSAPSIVVLASPPSWDLQFLARTLADVTRVPLTMFVKTQPTGSLEDWRDASTLQRVGGAQVRSALQSAQLVVVGGDPAQLDRLPLPATGAELLWPEGGGAPRGQEGDWYVDDPPSSELTPSLAGVAWDSLPPAAAIFPLSVDSASTVALSARLSRRGPARPVVVLAARGGGAMRRVEIAASGLYRWAFRGGASTEAYRTLVAALADWLMRPDQRARERITPASYEVPNGTPVVWHWTGSAAPRDVAVTMTSPTLERRDTLRFDATGASEQWLPPGVYRYQVQGGTERGMVAVETYSDEWRPATPSLGTQPGRALGRLQQVSARDRWWLFVVVIAAFAAEWAWRRRQGLP